MAETEGKMESISEDPSRFELVTAAFDTALERITTRVFTKKVFAECFPTAHRDYGDTLDTLRELMITKSRANVKNELAVCFEELNLKKNLDKLDQLEEEQKEFTGQRAWRPSGNPSKDLLAYEMAEKLALKESLKNYLAEINARVDSKKAKVEALAKECAELESDARSRLKKYQGVTDEMGEIASVLLV